MNSINYLILLSFLLLESFLQAQEPKTILMYSSRKEQLIKPLCDKFEAEKGVKIILHIGNDQALIEMIDREKDATKADILMTVDAGNLCYASSKDIFDTIKSDTLEKNIPKHLKDENNKWFGLSIRARTLIYSTERVKLEDLKGYADLAEPKWKGRLALRTSAQVYNQSLVAILIAIHGEEKTQKIVEGWVNNLATDVLENDVKIMDTIVAGTADVGIVNSYYFGRKLKDNPQIPLKLFWADQDSTGTHVNISGAGIIKFSKNKEEAKKFIEWLSEIEAQQMLASLNMEYPVNPKVKPDEMVQKWGDFKQCTVPLTKAGELQPEAVRLMKKAKYK